MDNLKLKKGFTLVEVLIVIAIITILVAAVVIAINPVRQFGQSRDTQRWTAVNSILNAIHQNMVDHQGNWSCAAGDFPSVATNMDPTGYDICSCLVPTYLASMPYDASDGSYTDCTTYDSGFTVVKDATTGRITVDAPSAEITSPISITR